MFQLSLEEFRPAGLSRTVADVHLHRSSHYFWIARIDSDECAFRSRREFLLICHKIGGMTVVVKRRFGLQKNAARRLDGDGLVIQNLTHRRDSAKADQPYRRPYRLKLAGWKADLQPGTNILDRDSLLEAVGKE
jgi:hypothetical protein